MDYSVDSDEHEDAERIQDEPEYSAAWTRKDGLYSMLGIDSGQPDNLSAEKQCSRLIHSVCSRGPTLYW